MINIVHITAIKMAETRKAGIIILLIEINQRKDKSTGEIDQGMITSTKTLIERGGIGIAHQTPNGSIDIKGNQGQDQGLMRSNR